MIYLALILAFALGIALAQLSREYTAADRIVRKLETLSNRMYTMATQADLDAAVAALSTAFNTGFDALEASIATETTAITAALAAAGGTIPDASVQAITDATAAISAKLAQAQTDIGSELPAAAPAPTS